MIKKCFIDTETTGLDPNKHHLHQVAAIIVNEDGKELDRINLRFKPKVWVYEDSALENCNITPDEILGRSLTSGEAFDKFIVFLEYHVNRFDKKDKLHFVAYNTQFDETFIRKWFDHHYNDFYGAYFWTPAICIQKVAAWFLQDHRDKIERFKLCNVCRFLGIDFDDKEAHDALYDIEKTLELHKTLSA